MQAGGQVLFVYALGLAGIAREFEHEVIEFVRPVAAFFAVYGCPLAEASSCAGKEIRQEPLPVVFLYRNSHERVNKKRRIPGRRALNARANGDTFRLGGTG